MTYETVVNKMIAYELNAKNPSDGRRVIKNERCALMARKQANKLTKSDIASAMDVLRMWL